MSCVRVPASLPARPPSAAEWEELLVRLEIAPRAARLALEDAGARAGALRGPLLHLVRRERWLARALEALRDGKP
ncbi:MAG TPA: hypothetical protein VFX98_11320, partial [Longimicrobiaceae bacterium]|nr:hypothetical protein [Longimicrobiaceae bacterium]